MGRRSKAKGGGFERELCRLLSLWWTDGARDDVYWRTAGSGGRATRRNQKGKATHNQHGDVQATDPIGNSLTRLVTIEAKRGYPHAHFGDLLDLDPEDGRRRDRPLEEFFQMAEDERKGSRAPYWLLVVQRDKRKPLVYVPQGLWLDLRDAGSRLDGARPLAKVNLPNAVVVYATLLSEFFKRVTSNHVKAVTRELC